MIKIQNGRVYDPKHGVNGEIRDIYYENGRIVAPSGEVTETYDANGCAVMAGGIDIHSHIAGEPLALLRDAKSPAVPTASRTGGEYARMGYTLAVNAAMPAQAARHTIAEENAIPALSTANLVWVGENPVLLELAEPATSLATTAQPGWVKVRHRDGQVGFARVSQVFGL